jgi:tRNA G18 (ribose-2'-O)-methylase SpoU
MAGENKQDKERQSPVVRNCDRKVPIEVYSRLARVPISVALDNLRSSFNVGSIFRTAECGRLEMIYTCGITAHPPADRVLKTAMGAAEFVPHRHVKTTIEAIGLAREKGADIIALETTNVSRSIFDPWPQKPVCLVMGNEALGLGEDVLAAADEIVEIPLLGYKNSLNVSVAFSVVMFEILRQWGELESLPG